MSIAAAVARTLGQPFTVEDLELDEPRVNEVRVRMVASGICHADAIVRDGVIPTPLPAVLGHEGAGVVEAVGAAVTTVDVGDHVLLAAAYCGTCNHCRAGQMAYCENLFAADFGGRRPDGSTAFTGGDVPVSSHFFGQSSFASYSNVVQECLVKLDPDVPLDLVAPLGCGLQTGAGTILNELKPQIGSTLVVLGTGAVGAGSVMAGRIAGCRKVIAVDIHDSRLELATEIGATDTINTSRDDLVEAVRGLTGGGADFIVDTTAAPPLLEQGAEALGLRGTLALVGAAPAGTTVNFEIGQSIVKGWTFTTVLQGSSVPQDFIPRLIGLWQTGQFPFDKLIKHYTLDDINQGFDDSKNGSTIKPVVRF